MTWLNPFGLIFMAVIMIPNLLFMRKHPEGFENAWRCRFVEVLEQISRFGCFAAMIFNVPGSSFGFFSDEAFALYLIVDAALTILYCGVWAVCFRKNSLFRALSLSILPSALFLFSGIVSRSTLLTLFALIFAPCHILISCKNALSS